MSPVRASGWMRSRGGTAWVHVAIMLALCALVYWPRLGHYGLRSTEGHRAIPAWETLETGRWLPTTMFETVYVRKPPGMPWAIAVSSTVFGETEFAARAPSAVAATLMAVMATVFAGRWFGRRWGIVAGLAQVLMPRFWPGARTADIEMLLCFGVQVASFALIHALVHRKATRGGAALLWTAVGAGGLIIALLAKAHAGLPAIAGVLAGVCIVRRGARPLLHPVVWGSAGLAAVIAAPVGWRLIGAMGHESAVTEDFAKFLWDPSRVLEWVIFPLAVFVAGMPASLAWLFPWGPDARREGDGGKAGLIRRRVEVARVLGLGVAIAVGVLMAAGVTNERYAMPVLGLLPPLAAYVTGGAAEYFTAQRAVIARWMMLGSPIVWPIVLLAGVAVFHVFVEPRDASSSAREAGRALGASLPDGAEVWADGFVGAKPELLWYARRRASEEGRRVRIRWMPGDVANAVIPGDGAWLLLNRAELARYERLEPSPTIHIVAEGVAHTTPFVLARIEAR